VKRQDQSENSLSLYSDHLTKIGGEDFEKDNDKDSVNED